MTTAVIQVVNSVYALKSFTQPKDGMLFKTLGKDAPFDGKAAEYMYKEGDISVADGIDVIDHYSSGGKFIAFKENTTGGGGDSIYGFVAITDITPTNPSDNVGNKTLTDDNNVLQSCTSSTTAVTVHVLAVTGKESFKPTVEVNGTMATLSRNALTDVWQGTAAITLSGSSPYTITAIHGEGLTDTATVNIESAPVISSLEFSSAYSQGVGQTQHAAGQTLNLTVTSATPFVALEVIANGTTATQALSQTFAATNSKTISVTVANQGNTPTAYPAKVRIRNANGTWSTLTASNAAASVDGVNIITLNNTQPSLSVNSISYPVGQSALKNSESATLNVTELNVDTVSYSSPNAQISITNPTTTGNKTVTRIAGGYNISTTNLSVTIGKTSNATSASFNTVVWVAHDAPIISITTPAARLRSGVTPQNHTISINSDQRTQATPTLTASVGTFSGAWSTANNGVTWTRPLAIADNNTKGAASFSGLSITNLAGIEVTAITTGAAYTVGGFVQRVVTFAAWPNREATIGTQVSDTSKLRVTNLSKGTSGSLNTNFVASVGDAIDTYTTTQPSATYNATGNTLYNRDLANAVSNTSGTAQFEIEELA